MWLVYETRTYGVISCGKFSVVSLILSVTCVCCGISFVFILECVFYILTAMQIIIIINAERSSSQSLLLLTECMRDIINSWQFYVMYNIRHEFAMLHCAIIDLTVIKYAVRAMQYRCDLYIIHLHVCVMCIYCHCCCRCDLVDALSTIVIIYNEIHDSVQNDENEKTIDQ